MRRQLGRAVSALAFSVLALACTGGIAQADVTEPADPGTVIVSDPGPGDGKGPKMIATSDTGSGVVVISNGDEPTTGPK